MKMGAIGGPETSVINQHTLRDNPEDGSLRSHMSGLCSSTLIQTLIVRKGMRYRLGPEGQEGTGSVWSDRRTFLNVSAREFYRQDFYLFRSPPSFYLNIVGYCYM